MGARYYNPYICRFISADPSGFGGGLNWYVYASGNPTSLIDPFGLGAQEAITGVSWLDKGLNYGLAQNAAFLDQSLDSFDAMQSRTPAWATPINFASALVTTAVGAVGNTMGWAQDQLARQGADPNMLAALPLIVPEAGAFSGDSGLIGVTSGESSALARQIYGIEVNGQPAVSSVEAFGSRAGSTFRGLGGPSATSDLDLRITLTDPAHFGAVNAEMTEIANLFQAAKGFPLEPTYVIPGLPPPVLLKTPFIPLKR